MTQRHANEAQWTCNDTGKYREVQLDLTPEIEVSHMYDVEVVIITLLAAGEVLLSRGAQVSRDTQVPRSPQLDP